MTDLCTTIADARRAAFEQRYPQAAALAQAALAEQPTCLLALRTLAWSRLELGHEAAPDTFARCAWFDPQDPLAHVGQAIWYERQGQAERAVAAYVRAWELAPHDQRLRWTVARVYGELPDSSLAEGLMLLQFGQLDAGAEVLRAAAAAAPGDAAVSLALLTALWRLRETRACQTLAAVVLVNHPCSVTALLYQTALEGRLGRTLRTLELVGRAELVDPGLDLYADVVRELGLQPVLEQRRARRATALAAASSADWLAEVSLAG